MKCDLNVRDEIKVGDLVRYKGKKCFVAWYKILTDPYLLIDILDFHVVYSFDSLWTLEHSSVALIEKGENLSIKKIENILEEE